MKKLYISAFAICMFAISANAQKVTYGQKLGTKISNLSGNFSIDEIGLDSGKKSLIGFTGGFFMDYKVNDKFSIQPEIIYSREGTSFEMTEGESSASFHVKNDYISIPISAKYHINNKVNLEFGPQVGFEVGSRLEMYSNEGNYGMFVKMKDYTNKTLFSLNFGINYFFLPKVGLNARYNLGLSKLYKTEFSDQSNKLSGFSFGVQYLFK